MSSIIIRIIVFVGVLGLSACQLMPAEKTTTATPEKPTFPASCECPVVEQLSCPPIPKPKLKISKPCPVNPPVQQPGRGLQIIGRVENAFLKLSGPEQIKLKLKARIDTGAGLSSMHAQELVSFERDGKPWVRFAVLKPKTSEPVFFERPVRRYVSIKQLGGNYQKRPIVGMALVLGDIEETVDVTLTDRSGYVYQVLIGRNFLRDRAVVDVSRKFIADDKLHLN